MLNICKNYNAACSTVKSNFAAISSQILSKVADVISHKPLPASISDKNPSISDLEKYVDEFNSKEDRIFNQIPNQIKVGHYHSWVIDEATLPSCLEITSKNEDGIIMSICHKEYDLKGLQFHPESILTEYGLLMIKNWISS